MKLAFSIYMIVLSGYVYGQRTENPQLKWETNLGTLIIKVASKEMELQHSLLIFLFPDKDVHSVMLEEGESSTPFILCNLSKPVLLQSHLDLNFETGDRITFFCKGSGTIHLTGNAVVIINSFFILVSVDYE